MDVVDFFLCGGRDDTCVPVCGTVTADERAFTLTVRQPGEAQPETLAFSPETPVSEVLRALVRRMA